jgi:hypothetical protein
MLNLANLKTPGVYIDEVSLFPPSVAQVATAIPVFIGKTQKALKDGKELFGIATRISSMPEFELYFGGATNSEITVTLDNLDNVVSVEPEKANNNLYYSLRMFYANGGGACYILSIPVPQNGKSILENYQDVIDSLETLDEPTLIVAPDLVNEGENDFYSVSGQIIKHCAKLQDRFAILDVHDGYLRRSNDEHDIITKFRDKIGSEELKYAAAYYPWIKTSIGYRFTYSSIKLIRNANVIQLSTLTSDANIKSKIDQIEALSEDLKKSIGILTTDLNGKIKDPAGADERAKNDSAKLSISAHIDSFNALGFAYKDNLLSAQEKNSGKLLSTESIFENYKSKQGSRLQRLSDEVTALNKPTLPELQKELFRLLADVQAHIGRFVGELQNRADALDLQLIAMFPIYANIVNAIRREGVVLPPSGAIAGIYAKTDSARGVWKAPANISLSFVVEPAVKITDAEQDDLNVDVNAGKSINAIRHFTGKGTLVWGARTLAGNDNEWRYVPVRRFFIMVEESVKKATSQFVFEPNDANTWVKVRAMIENFLTLQWRAGALAGAKPEHAFYVRVGLNQTMTQLDILEGRMIVEIGMAVVRPAEFIVLRFMHKMQES